MEQMDWMTRMRKKDWPMIDQMQGWMRPQNRNYQNQKQQPDQQELVLLYLLTGNPPILALRGFYLCRPAWLKLILVFQEAVYRYLFQLLLNKEIPCYPLVALQNRTGQSQGYRKLGSQSVLQKNYSVLQKMMLHQMGCFQMQN